MATAGVGGLPSFTGMVPGQFPDPAKSVAAIGPQNPSQASPDDGPFSLNGVIEEDKKLLVETISEYRGSWAQDRLERIRQ